MANCIVDYTTHVNAANTDSTVHNIADVNTMSTYTARSLLNLVTWFQSDYRNAIVHIKHARSNSDATEKSSLAKSLSVLMDMEHDGVRQKLGLAAYGGDEAAEGEIIFSSSVNSFLYIYSIKKLQTSNITNI